MLNVYEVGESVFWSDRYREVLDVSFYTPNPDFSPELSYRLEGIDDWVWVKDCQEELDEDEFFKQDAYSPQLQQLGYSMVAWMDGLENRPDNSTLPPIATFLMAIQYDKEGSYGSSWKGKGEYRGIMSNIDRKYDRLDTITKKEIEGKMKPFAEQEKMLSKDYEVYSVEVGESKVDAIADLTCYGLLYLAWVRVTYPNVFRAWVDRSVPKYLLDKITL
jgi:hypothetical protein